MSESLTQKIRHDFDLIALHDQERWNHNNHYHHFLLKQLPPQCRTALDIGCGTGEFSRLLAQRVERVMAIDLSPNMIKIAKQRSRQFPNIDFQVADVMLWEPPTEKMDLIVSIATLHHVSIERLLPNLKAALNPGGRLVILDLLKYETLQDRLSDVIAVPLNWVYRAINNRQFRPSPEAVEAMREHLRTDEYLTLSQARQIYPHFLNGAHVRKHLFWRYSMVWRKSTAI